MQYKENDITTLVDLGLNKTQARVYLALVEKGILSIKNASEYSGVGRPEAYRAMLELNQRGLIETILSSPTTYRPLPLTETITILMGQKQQKMIELKEKSNKLLQEYENKKTLNQGEFFEREFVLLAKGSSGTKKAVSSIKTAQTTIDFVISIKQFNQLLLTASEDIVEAANRGVKIRFIIDKNTAQKSWSKILSSLQTKAFFKYRDEVPQPFMAIYDSKEVLMATTGGDFCQTSMLWSNNGVLVGTIQNYFKLVWLCKQPRNFKSLNKIVEQHPIGITVDYKESLHAPIP